MIKSIVTSKESNVKMVKLTSSKLHILINLHELNKKGD